MLGRLTRVLIVAGIVSTSVLSATTPVAAQSDDGLKVRKNVCALTAEERARFVAAVKTLKETYRPGSDISVYDQFVLWHQGTLPIMAAHMAPAFLPWHREFVYRFEQELQSVDPSVTVPYWDFTQSHLDDDCLWTDDFMGGNGDPEDRHIVKTGPFRQGEWTIRVFDPFDDNMGEEAPTNANPLPYLTRGFGTHPGGDRLPTYREVLDALGIPTYDVEPWDDTSNWTCSFRNSLEGFRPGTEPRQRGPHNITHNWVGGRFNGYDGTVAQNGVSPNDPVFWLIHSNVDRIWAEWQRRYGEQYAPMSGGRLGQNYDDPMWPFGVTPADVMDHHALGYRYDVEGPDAFPGAVTGGTPCVPDPVAASQPQTAAEQSHGMSHGN